MDYAFFQFSYIFYMHIINYQINYFCRMSSLLRFSYIFSLSLSTKMYSPQAPHLTVLRRVTIEVTALPITISFNLIFKKEMLHLKVHQESAPSSLIKGFPIIFKMNCRTSIPTSNGQ